MQNMIIVGIGECFRDYIAPSLKYMEKGGLVKILATVDIKEMLTTKLFPDVGYKPRRPDQSLDKLISDLRGYEPVVILSHPTNLHTPDAKNLVSNGYKVLVEKPYSADNSQLRCMKEIASTPNITTRIALLDYYLTMKCIPLLIVGGVVKNDSFYLKEKGVVKAYCKSKNPIDLCGKIKELIGEPKSVIIDILEGKGKTGKVEHRGEHLFNIKKGGGMLQDLGIHAIAPLLALEDYIGTIDLSFSQGSVKVAKCKGYVEAVSKKYGLQNDDIGESYADMAICSSKGVPIRVSLGKYVLNNKNQRRIIIVGDEGFFYHNMSNNRLYLSINESLPKLLLECPPKPDKKYYAVIKAGLEQLNSRSPFIFNQIEIPLKAQEFVLNVLKKSSLQNAVYYQAGTNPQNIFP